MNIQDKAYCLHSYLPIGRQNAVTMESLKYSTGFSRRVITDCMQYLRKEGIPICSCNSEPGGYFIADNVNDVLNYITRLTVVSRGITQNIADMNTILLTMVGDENVCK